MTDENEEFEFRARAEQETAPQPDHSNVVSKSLAATVSSPFGLPSQSVHAAPAWKRGLAAFPGLGPLSDPEKKDWTPEEQDMAKSGTDITSGAPMGLRNHLSLLVNPSDKEVRDVINQSYGQDVGLARNKYGELEYTNPQSGRRTLLNPRSETLQSLAPTVGAAMDTAGQVGGATAAGVPTAMATGNPLLTMGAGALGAGVGQSISDSGKTVVNHFLFGGVGNKEPEEQLTDIARNAVKTVGYTAAGSLVGGVPAAARFAGRGFLDLKYKQALDLQGMAREAAEGLNDYYSLIGGQAGVKPSITELVPNSGETRIKYQNAYKASPNLTAEEERRINSNLDSLSYNYQNFTSAFKPNPSYEYGSSGYNIQQALEAKKAQALGQQQANQAILRADAKSQIDGLPAMTETERNQELTGMLNKLEQAGKQAKDKAYGDLKSALGAPPNMAYDRTSRQWLSSRDPSYDVSVSPTAQAQFQNMWTRGMQLEKSAVKSGDKYFSAIPEDFFVDVNNPSKGLTFNRTADKVVSNEDKSLLGDFGIDASSVPGTPKRYDVLDLIDNVQDIRSGTRAAMAASKGRLPADEAAANHAGDILEQELKDHLASYDPKVLDLWSNAKQANIQYEENFGRGIINTVMKKTGGFEDPVYNSATGGLLMRAGRGQDQSGVTKFADILKGAPEEKERVRNMIWSIYKDKYGDTPTQTTWNKFKDDMEGPIKYFFSDAEKAKMGTFDDMTTALAASSRSLQNFRTAWKSGEYGGIPATSQGLSNAVFREATPPAVLDKMLKVVGSLQPQLMKEWKADTARQLALRTADASGMPVDSLLSKYLGQYGERLSKVMGPQYVQNLRTLQRVSGMVQGGGGVHLDPDRPQSILTQVIRAKFAPPLSEEGRWYSALLNWRKKAAGRVVYNALKSPEGLDDFIKLSQINSMTPLATGILGRLNGDSLAQSFQGTEGPTNSSSESQTRQ